MDVVTLALAKKYTDEAVAGAGAIQGEKGDPGPQGPEGPQGPAGPQGPQGEPGYYYTPSVSTEGDLSWTNNGDLTNPQTVNIRGPQGEQGEAGLQGPAGSNGTDGTNGVTFTPSVSAEGVISFTNDGNLSNPTPVDIKGPQGDVGPAGRDGYLVNDAQVYSTNETVIGYYTDGKPIYRLILTGSTASTPGTSVTIPLSSYNIDSVIKCEAIVNKEDTNVYVPSGSTFSLTNDTNEGYCRCWINNYSFTLQDGSIGRINCPFTAILEYTKTTDTAQTPIVAIPTKYSEDETICGFWIDGKPIYRKVFVTTTPSKVNSVSIVATYSDISVDKVIKLNGVTEHTANEQEIFSEIERYNGDSYLHIYVDNTNKRIIMSTSEQTWTNITCYIIFEYTKETTTL